MDRIQEALQTLLTKLPQWLVLLGAAALLVDEFLRSRFSISFLRSNGVDLRTSIGIAVTCLFVLVVSAALARLQRSVAGLSQTREGDLGVMRQPEGVDFVEVLKSSRDIRVLTLSGTKVTCLGDARVQALLRDENRKSRVVLLLANPFAPAIAMRYREDEPATFEAGLGGIHRRLLLLHALQATLSPAARKRLLIKVYNNYPVVSVIQADDDIYSSAYGYKLRGADCPIVHASVHGVYGRFLLSHFDQVLQRAIPLAAWMQQYGDLEEAALTLGRPTS